MKNVFVKINKYALFRAFVYKYNFFENNYGKYVWHMQKLLYFCRKSK